MTPAVLIGTGFCLGGAAGLLAARDFVRAAVTPTDSPIRAAVLGMLRRAGLFLGVLVAAVALGGLAWAGAAAGYLAVFMAVAFRRGLAHGR